MDSRHRALERVARAGDPTDVARHLAERLRVGDLSRPQLELAAYCGDEAARLVVDVVYSPVDYDGFVQGLPDVALLRGLVAAAQATLPHLALAPGPRDAAACVLEAARAFCVDPSDRLALAWRRSESEKRWLTFGSFVPQGWLPLAHLALGDVYVGFDVVRGQRRRLVRCSLLAEDVATVRAAVERELIAWALA